MTLFTTTVAPMKLESKLNANRIPFTIICMRVLRGFAKLKTFQKSKNNLEVGGWVQVSFG